MLDPCVHIFYDVDGLLSTFQSIFTGLCQISNFGIFSAIEIVLIVLAR